MITSLLTLAANETYIKIKGVNHYIWFIMDALKDKDLNLIQVIGLTNGYGSGQDSDSSKKFICLLKNDIYCIII